MNNLATKFTVIFVLGVCHMGYNQTVDTTFQPKDFLSIETFLVGYTSQEDSYNLSGGFGFNQAVWLSKGERSSLYWGLDLPIRFYTFPKENGNTSLNSLSGALLLRANFPVKEGNNNWYYFAGVGPEVFATFSDKDLSYLGQLQLGVMRDRGDSFFSKLQLGTSLSYDFSSNDELTLLNTLFFRFNLW